jgi:hypothetical protein
VAELTAKKIKKHPRDERNQNSGRKDAGDQPRPRLPLLSGGKDPTLAERFEEELNGRKMG